MSNTFIHSILLYGAFKNFLYQSVHSMDIVPTTLVSKATHASPLFYQLFFRNSYSCSGRSCAVDTSVMSRGLFLSLFYLLN